MAPADEASKVQFQRHDLAQRPGCSCVIEALQGHAEHNVASAHTGVHTTREGVALLRCVAKAQPVRPSLQVASRMALKTIEERAQGLRKFLVERDAIAPTMCIGVKDLYDLLIEPDREGKPVRVGYVDRDEHVPCGAQEPSTVRLPAHST